MKADTILRLCNVEHCSPVEIALALHMHADNVRRVIKHGGWPKHRGRRAVRESRINRLVASVRA